MGVEPPESATVNLPLARTAWEALAANSAAAASNNSAAVFKIRISDWAGMQFILRCCGFDHGTPRSANQRDAVVGDHPDRHAFQQSLHPAFTGEGLHEQRPGEF